MKARGQLAELGQLVGPVLQAVEEQRSSLRVRLDERRRELVPAHPSGEVRPAQRVAEGAGERLDRPVACGMAERVVDLLEAVEVDEDEREAVLVADRARELELDLADERLVVEQSGELVVARAMGELRGGAVEVGDDAFGHEPVDRVVQAALDEQHLPRAELGRPLRDETPENAPQEEELGHDLTRCEAQGLPLACVVPRLRGECASEPEPLAARLDELRARAR